MSRSGRRAKDEGNTKTGTIRIGPQYQADIPKLDVESKHREHPADLLHRPDSSEECNPIVKKALGNQAVRWTNDEKANFKKCLSRHKKRFNRYKDLLPNKSIVHLLDYYYSTKIREIPETNHRDPDYSPGRHKKCRPKKPPTNVKVLFSRKVESATEATGKLRFNVQDIQDIIAGDETAKQFDELRAKSEHLKSELARSPKDDSNKIEQYRRLCTTYNRTTGTAWTDNELILAVHAIRVYGKDFKAVAKLIGTKTETQVKLFFVNYRERYNLEAMVRLFEEDRKNGIIGADGGCRSPKIDVPVVKTSPVKKLLRSPLKKPNILVRRKLE